jgi:hypothetical protein
LCSKDIIDSSIEKVKWILENHTPLQLSADVSNDLAHIMKAADQELLKKTG